VNILFFGLGRIGLPQALVLASKGFNVYGFDIDKNVIKLLLKKRIPFYEPEMGNYLEQYLNKTFHPIVKWKDNISNIDTVFFTLNTMEITSEACLIEKEFDLSVIKNVVDQIFQCKNMLKKNIKLIFRTTLALGSVDKIKNYIEAKYSLIESKDFYLAFVPERLVEGRAMIEEETIPKIIGTFTDRGFDEISAIFKKVGGNIIRVSNPTTAEFCKLTDNSYRSTIFSFSNELAICADNLGVDVIEVLNAVNLDYNRNSIPFPGFVSGYCLGKDPYIFEFAFKDIAKDRGFNSLWYYGRRANDNIYDYTVNKILNRFSELNKDIKSSKIVVLGMSFKEDVDDFRMSHSIGLIEKLIAKGCNKFRVFDSNIENNKYTKIPKSIEDYIEYKTNSISKKLFSNADVVLIAHRHEVIRVMNDKQKIRELLKEAKKPLYIFDGWNIWRDAIGIEGVFYEALGYRGLKL